MASPFTFNGKTMWRPGILVRSAFGIQRAFQLLPFGTIAMFGAADGGTGGGTVYQFDDIGVAERLLRSGPLLDALKAATNLGGYSGIVAVVCGAKTPGTATVTGAAPGAATVTSGDEGTWVNNISITIAAGSTSGFMTTFSWPNWDGSTLTYGGKGTKFDNLVKLSDLAAAIKADPVLTPAASTGMPPILTMNVTQDGNLQAQATTKLTGGTGGGASTLAYADYKAGIDASIETPYDIGHLVACYDATSQAYADAQCQQVYPLGRLRRFIHQVSTTATASQDLVTNSAALTSAGTTAAASLDSIRSSVCVQKLYTQDPNSGSNSWVDGAILAVGLAALKGATGAWGPATPLTYEFLSTVSDVDYTVMSTTGDVDQCVQGGVFLFERVGRAGQPGSVRVLQSLTTAPKDSAGNSWAFSEFSVVRASDALLANVKAAVEAAQPKAIGAGNTTGTKNAVLAQVTDVLELALDQQWITEYDPKTVQIVPSGSSGSDDIVKYSAAPTLPLNHIGIDQTLIPFQTAAATGGVVNG